MRTQLFILMAFAILFGISACNGDAKYKRSAIEEISVSIPVEFEQNDDLKQFILNYQHLINDFKQVAAEMLSIAGIDIITGEERISEEHLKPKNLREKAKLDIKLSEISANRDAMIATMQRKLPELSEAEQRALRGVIGLIDSHTGQFGASFQAQNTGQVFKDEAGIDHNEEQAALKEETSVQAQSNKEFDEETRHMLAEREAEIQHLKESGEWEKPGKNANTDTIYIIVIISIGGILLIYRMLFRKGLLKRNSFTRAGKSSFTQGLSHMASEIKGNLEKIPMDQIKNDPNINSEDRKRFQQGETLLMDLIGQNTKEQNKTIEHPNLEDAPPIISHENLKQLYQSELKSSTAGIESKRKEVIRSFAIMLLIILSILPSLFLISSAFYLNVIALFILVILALVFFAQGVTRYLKYRSEYKASVVKKVVQFINPKYLYDANKHISLNDFVMSRLGSSKINKVVGDDYICGKIANNVFEFSELIAQYEWEDTDQDGKKIKRVENHFNGLFFLADFNKHIQGETFVVPDTVERLLGKFGQKLQKSNKGELVKLENPEFEKYFAVFSTHQVEARYILTPAIMEGMVNIRRKTGVNCYFSFIGERVYCGIEFNKALFEASIFRPMKFADVEFMHSLFALIETIIIKMNLNTRIWTKR